MSYTIIPHTLDFKSPGGTSRGVLYSKDSWMIVAKVNDDLVGIGECSLIQNLSPDYPESIEATISRALSDVPHSVLRSVPSNFPAVKFGIETFIKSSHCKHPCEMFENDFLRGESGIPINGLIWMDTKNQMFLQIKEKIKQGYSCIKLKIGAIDFSEELSLLKYIRTQFSDSDIELRVDANGAFTPKEALDKLRLLAALDIHSIEQPIRPNQWSEMAYLCAVSPLPIALDEELIGIKTNSEKVALLELIKPHYIILKPSLVGGWSEAEEWITLAKERKIGWWATSALESNIGLNAIAQWLSTFEITMPQGLGTGGLFTNNINSPLYVKDASLWYDPEGNWDLSIFSKITS